MASKNYRYLKDGSKNPNYKPATTKKTSNVSTNGPAAAQKTNAGSSKVYRYDKQGKLKNASAVPAVDRNPEEEKKKVQLPNLKAWGNAVKDFLTGGGDENEAVNVNNGNEFDAQFTEDFFNNNDRAKYLVEKGIDGTTAQEKAEFVIMDRMLQAGVTNRSKVGGDDNRYKTSDEVYDVNNTVNQGANQIWMDAFYKQATEDDIRAVIGNWQQMIDLAPEGSDFKRRAQADLDSLKDYAKNNFSSFANEAIRSLGDDISATKAEMERRSTTYNADLLAAANDALEASRSGGYNLYDYVNNRPELREAVGFDELEAQYEDPDDFNDALRSKLETISGAEKAMQDNTFENEQVLGRRLTEQQHELENLTGIYTNLLKKDKFDQVGEDAAALEAGYAFEKSVAAYDPGKWVQDTVTGINGDKVVTDVRFDANKATLDQIVKNPAVVREANNGLEMPDADTDYKAALAAEMLPEEKEKYWALRAGVDGEARSAEYFDWLTKNELSRRNYERQLAATEVKARMNPIQSSLASLGTNLLGAIGGTADTLRGMFGMEVDQYGPNQMYTRKTQAIRETVGEEIAKKWDWTIPGLNVNAGALIYNTVMSIGDMAVAIGIGGGVGGGAGTNAGKALTQIIMSSEAAASAFTDAIDRGIDPQVGAWEAVAAGLIEGFTDKYSLDALFKDVTPDSLKSTIKYIAQNALTEGSEEIAADVLNDAVDILMNTSDAELWEKYTDYVNNGYDSNGALTRLFGEALSKYGVSGVAGAVTGGVMAGGNVAVQTAQQNAEYRSLGQQIIDNGNASAVIRAGLASADAKIRNLAKRLSDKISEIGLPQDSETAAEIQVVAESEGIDANGQKVETAVEAPEEKPTLEIKQPEGNAVAAQKPAEQASIRAEEAPAEEIAEETGSSSANEGTPELAWNKETAAPADKKPAAKVETEAVKEAFKGSAKKLGKLYSKVMKALDVDISTKGVADMTGRIKARLKQLGEDTIDPVAEAIAKLVTGEKPTQEQLDLLEGNTLREGVLNEVTRSIIRNGGSEFLSDATQNQMTTRTALQQATTQKGVQLPDTKKAAAPQEKVQAIVEETVAADEEGTIQARANMLGNEEAAQTMINMAEGVTNTHAYAAAFEDAYDFGTAGIDENVARTSALTTALTPEQFKAAYQAGVKAAAAPVRAAKTGGKVTFAGNLGSRLNEMNGNQRTAINALRKIASLGTVNIEFFQSEANAEGKYTAENGSYDPKTNTIRIDVNAGRNSVNSVANYALLRVAGHELTHYIKAHNAEGYKALQDFVVKQLTATGGNSFDALVANKMVQQPDLSYAAAVEEVVADGCEMMLKDSTAIQQLAQENKGLFRRIRNWLRSFIANVKRAFRGVEATSTEAWMIKDLEGLQKLWDDALVQASRNVQQSAAEALHMSTETQQAIEDDQAVDAEAEVKHAIRRDSEFGEDALRMNQTNGFVSAADLRQALADRKVIRDIFLDPANRDLLKLPPDIEGDTFVSDASYGGTEENTTVCIRSMAAQALMDLISQNLGRPLTVQDTLLISQEIAGLTDRPECYYCYVATDRRAYRDFLGQYLKQRDDVIDKYKSGADRDVLYDEFLGGRKPTANMRTRFNMWLNSVDNGIALIDGNDLASLENLFAEVDSLRSEILVAAADVSGIEAGKLNIVNGSVRYAKAGKQVTATTLNALKKYNPGMAAAINRYMQLTDATNYAQSASWAKKMKGYAAYNGHILNWSQKRVNDLNKHYGLRMYSFSDFSPAFILENMQMVTDAAVRGLNMLGYTKEMPFAEIFAPSGMNINISTFAYEQGGEVKEDYKQGASWERAKALREKHPNVGIVMVATSDNILEWALQQDWVDVVIPYHLVRTGTDVAEYFGYKNYTGVSADGKGLSFVEKNKGKTKKERVTSVSPVEHRNDLISYVDALERYGLTPRFARWLNGLDDYLAGKISPNQFRDMNPNYMKLVNETRRSYADTDPVQPKFDMGAAKEAINQMIREGGYYTPVGGSVEAEFEIAGAVADKIRDSGVRYSRRDGIEFVEDKYYGRLISKITDMKDGSYIKVGQVLEESILNQIGLPAAGLYFDVTKIKKQLESHDDHITDRELRMIPEILRNPIVIVESTKENTASVYGELMAGNSPVMVAIVITKGRGGRNLINKVRTIHARRDFAEHINDDTVLYLNEDKKRTRDWFQARGIDVPLGGINFGFIRSIAYSEPTVKKSIRTDSLTDREILADAFETVASNDTERSFLKNYREKIADLQKKQEQLRKINKDITDRKANAARTPNGRIVYDEELIKQQNRAKILREQIDREDNAIIAMIKSKPLQDVLRRQKKQIEQAEAKKRQEAISAIRDRKNATEVRHKIKAVLDDFNRRLKSPTEKSYIPANMVQLVIAAEELIDTRSGREGEKAQAKLAALQGMYERYKSDATFAYVYDPVIADMLGSLSSVVGNKSIYQLNSAELQSVYETLKALKKQVTEAVQLKAGNYARTIIEAGREMIRETAAAAPLAKGKVGEFLNWQLTPDKFFARLAGFKKNSIWSKVAESFSKGTEKMLEIQRDHYYHFKRFTESKEFDKLNDQKHLVDIGLTNDKGETVKVTRGMMLSAYMHLLNEENARGFMYGGFSIPNLKAYYNGKVKESYGRGSANTRGTAQELYELAQQMNDPSLTEEQLAALEAKHDQLIMEGMNRLEKMRSDIYNQMTQYEKDLVEAVRAWNDGKSQQYINDVTMDLYGIKKASVQNYFPIHRDTAFVNTDFASISRNVNLENWGSLKTRVPSQAPILLTDIAYEMDSSLNQMSRYVGYAKAQRDFNKLYNVRMPGMSGSVKKAVSVKFGTGAGLLGVSGEQYIENYIGSITGSRQGQSGPLSLIRRNLVRSTMTLNLRVGFSQLSAIPKAAAEVGLDSMLSGLGRGGLKAIFSKSDREDLAKQNAWFWQRYRGEGGQREFADAKGGNDIISKLWNGLDDITRGKLLNWCQNFDVMSTVSMWSMAKAWARKHTNYAEGSAEFLEAANQKYTDILRNTQAMSTTTERSDASRNTSDGWNLFMMFKSEAFANFNLLYDAVAKLRKYNADFKAGANDVTRADVNAAKRHLAGAAMSVIIGASLGNAILKLGINALMHAMNGYRDDEDEIRFESILTAIGKEMGSDITGMVLLGGELYEFISAAIMGDKYYAPTDMALGEVTELLETVMKVAQDEDRTAEEVLSAGKKVAFNLTNIFGVPAENGKRFVKMIQDWYDERNHDTPWYKFEGGLTRTNSMNYDRLYNAAIAGDDEKFGRVLVELEGNGKDEKGALEEFRTRIKKAYQGGELTEAEATDMLVTYGGKDNDEAFWTMDEWNYNGEGNYSRYADLRTALNESNVSTAQAEIQKLTSHGVKEDSVFKEIAKAYNNGTATNIVNLQICSDRLFTNQAKPKGAKKEDKADPNAFDAFIAAVLSGRGLSAEIARLEAQGYKTKNFMTALNKAFGGDDGRYRRMEYYNPSEARVLLDRILNAYEAIGKDRNEEIAWINENWEKFVPEDV